MSLKERIRARIHRDPVEIAREYTDKIRDDQLRRGSEELRQAYERVFGYTPELGEPDEADERLMWSIYGFWWSAVRPLGLFVLLDTGKWVRVDHPGEFAALLDKGVVTRSD